MADNGVKITSEEKTKVKDPKRVESGKRLAAISKMAKERKKLRREAEEKVRNSEESSSTVPYVVGGIALVGVGYLAYKKLTEPVVEPGEETPTTAKKVQSLDCKKYSPWRYTSQEFFYVQ